MRDYVVNGVHFVQPRNFALSLAVVHVSLVKETSGYRVVSMRPELIPLATVTEQPRFVRRFTAAHERARAWADAARHREPGLFRALRARGGHTAAGFHQRGAASSCRRGSLGRRRLRPGAGLPEGEVRERDVAGIYPYENTLRAVRISGSQLKAYLDKRPVTSAPISRVRRSSTTACPASTSTS